jgi:hypothetical protein
MEEAKMGDDCNVRRKKYIKFKRGKEKHEVI